MHRYIALIFLSLHCLAFGTDAPIEPAILKLEGEPLFEFRTRVGSVPPADRVRLITARLTKLLDDPLI